MFVHITPTAAARTEYEKKKTAKVSTRSIQNNNNIGHHMLSLNNYKSKVSLRFMCQSLNSYSAD